MPKRCIGINISASFIRAVQMTGSGGNLKLEKSFASTRSPSHDDPVAALKSLTARHGFDKRAAVALNLDPRKTFYANIETLPAKTAQAIAVRDIRQDDFPLAADEIITAAIPNRRRSLHEKEESMLVTAAGKKSLHRRFNLAQQANLNCQSIDAPVFALQAEIEINHPEIAADRAIILYSDNDSIILTAAWNHDILIARNLPCFLDCGNDVNYDLDNNIRILIQEIEITWRVAFGGKIPEKTNLVLAGEFSKNSYVTNLLENELPCKITHLDNFRQIDVLKQPDKEQDFTIALGLAIRNLAPTKTIGVNLLNTQKQLAAQNLNITKTQIITAAILAAGLVLAFLGNILFHKYRLENINAQLENQARQIISETLPADFNIIDDVAAVQLIEQLELIKNQYTLLQPYMEKNDVCLATLQLISACTPPELDITVNAITISDAEALITASCSNYWAQQTWKDALMDTGKFQSVKIIKPVRADADAAGQITFTVNAALKQEAK